MDVPIVFYDGDCGFCNRSVQFVLDHEKSAEIHFSALQSEFAVAFFQEHSLPDPDLSTFYYWNGERMCERSSGALRLSARLRFPWPLLVVFLIVPAFMRNGVYNWIAKRRHRLAAGSCALPTAEQRKRFLS